MLFLACLPRILLQPTLLKDYYTLLFKLFKLISKYLTYVKILEKKSNATKVVLNVKKLGICFSIS